MVAKKVEKCLIIPKFLSIIGFRQFVVNYLRGIKK